MAGRSNIIWWLEQNGYQVTDELVSHLFEVAKSQRRNMLDSEVQTAVRQFLNQ
jgi:predicted subunit of tRNA(5-methylaminomethyl-2-thiouridylate) methyltransferase